MRKPLIELRKFLILRRPRSGRLEGRTMLIQAVGDFLTPSFAENPIGVTFEPDTFVTRFRAGASAEELTRLA